VYVTYISTTPEKLWKALVDARITTRYWQHVNVSDWNQGSHWEHRRTDTKGEIMLVDKVIEIAPPRRLVLTWANPSDEARLEKHTQVTFELEQLGEVVRLTVSHDQLEAGKALFVVVHSRHAQNGCHIDSHSADRRWYRLCHVKKKYIIINRHRRAASGGSSEHPTSRSQVLERSGQTAAKPRRSSSGGTGQTPR